MQIMLDNLNIKDVKLQIGQLVKILRKKERLTQNQLGEKLDLSRITVQNLESGKNATLDTLLKVLQYFDKLQAFQDNIDNEISNNNYESLY
jgi:transcriptional regulator with XRE-family HTH domain